MPTATIELENDDGSTIQVSFRFSLLANLDISCRSMDSNTVEITSGELERRPPLSRPAGSHIIVIRADRKPYDVDYTSDDSKRPIEDFESSSSSNQKQEKIIQVLKQKIELDPKDSNQAREQEVTDLIEESTRFYPVRPDPIKKLNKYFERVSSINQELKKAVRELKQEIVEPKPIDFENLDFIFQKLVKAVRKLKEEIEEVESEELGSLNSLNQKLKKVVRRLKKDITQIKPMIPDSAENLEEDVNSLSSLHQKMEKAIQELTQEIPVPLTSSVDPDRLGNHNNDFKNLSSIKQKLEKSIKELTHEMAILIVAYILFGSIIFHSIVNPAVVLHIKWWIPSAIFLSIALIFWTIFQAIFKKFRRISNYYNDTVREQKNVRELISSIQSGSTSRYQLSEKPHEWRRKRWIWKLLYVRYQRFLDLLYAYSVHFGLLAFTGLNLYACVTIPQ